MKTDQYYLKPNVVIEPLIERWYAWSHLISPVTAAMNVVGRHLKIMNSYIQSSEIHAAAVKNPKLLGGPFMDYPVSKVEEVKQLKARTIERQHKLIGLAADVKLLDAMLKENAKGYSLENLYPKVPSSLKGYVELVYDLNNNPSFTLYERLLYKSDFYDKSFQSIALWVTNNDERPFCLSTPRLDDPDILHIDVPFDHEAIDELSRMKREPNGIDRLAEMFNLSPNKRSVFNSLFTNEAPPKYQKYEGNKARMRYFGHACILLETKEVSVLVDPLISYYGYETSVDHFSDMDLPEELDYVLITHNHQDHILFETLLPLRNKIKNLIVPRTTSGNLQDPNLKLMFTNLGFKNVIEIEEMEELSFSNCTITGVPFTGEHSDLNIRAKTCFHVQLGKFSFLFVADSRILESELYKHVEKEIGHIDVIFLGMECDGAPLSWLYGPLLTEELPRDKDQTRRLSGSDFERGIHLVDIFSPKEVYVYAMGQEPWVEFISTVKYTEESNPIIQSDLLIKECLGRGVFAERLFGEKEILYDYKD